MLLQAAMWNHLVIHCLLQTTLCASVSISVGIKNLNEFGDLKDLKKVIPSQNSAKKFLFRLRDLQPPRGGSFKD